jgi:hypothetical protein
LKLWRAVQSNLKKQRFAFAKFRSALDVPKYICHNSQSCFSQPFASPKHFNDKIKEASYSELQRQNNHKPPHSKGKQKKWNSMRMTLRPSPRQPLQEQPPQKYQKVWEFLSLKDLGHYHPEL